MEVFKISFHVKVYTFWIPVAEEILISYEHGGIKMGDVLVLVLGKITDKKGEEGRAYLELC